MKKKKSAYEQAGVSIDTMDAALQRIKRDVRRTATPDQVSDLGMFGGLFRAPGRDFLLVSSIDGVGTKLKVAHLAGRHDTIGQDLVNHCVNDILVQGAEPLFFMDYVGTSRLDPNVFRDVVKGLCKACRENGCALIGGETAEMPGLYPRSGEYDLVGAIIGAVLWSKAITGDAVRAGDIVIGLPSSGLHTNGYSLARKVIFEQAGLAVDDPFPGMKKSVGEVLLTVHKSYLKPIRELLKEVPVHAMAHITGGGLRDNIPRVLPEGLNARIRTDTWRVPRVFSFIEETGGIEREEMIRVFNMGIGLTVMVHPRDEEKAMRVLKKNRAAPHIIGEIVDGTGKVELV